MYTCTKCRDDYDPVTDWCSCEEEKMEPGLKTDLLYALQSLLPEVKQVYGPNALLAVIDMEEPEFGEVVLEVKDEG